MENKNKNKEDKFFKFNLSIATIFLILLMMIIGIIELKANHYRTIIVMFGITTIIGCIYISHIR